MDHTTACLVLARTPGLKAKHVHAMVAEAGSLEQAIGESARGLQVELPPPTRNYLVAPEQADIAADLRWIEASGAELLPCSSHAYPQLLARTIGAPPVLYVLGDVEVLAMPQLAMVGSRNPTADGRATAKELAAFFARAGLTITSGLALGIDAASHEGALAANGFTIAVCGCGLDKIYPRQHGQLAMRIREQGAVISEFPPRSKPLRAYFPQRNRIISGLSLGTLVVEAARHSGSLITARLAAEQGREVFAIPGSIHNPLSKGCHKLIREGAKLVEGAEDVLCELAIPLSDQSLAPRAVRGGAIPSTGSALDKEYEMLLDALGFAPASIDVLVERCGFPSESVASMLLILELEGRVAPHPGGRYGRVLS
jgi:DNA processing protein